MNNLFRQSFGLGAGEVIADTNARTAKKYQLLYFVEDTVIASITAPQLTSASSLATKTFKAGSQLAAYVTAVTLTSGTCIAYDSQDSAV